MPYPLRQKQIPVIILSLSVIAVFMLLLCGVPAVAAQRRQEDREENGDTRSGKTHMIEYAKGAEIHFDRKTVSGRLPEGFCVEEGEAPFIVDGVSMERFSIEPEGKDVVVAQQRPITAKDCTTLVQEKAIIDRVVKEYNQQSRCQKLDPNSLTEEERRRMVSKILLDEAREEKSRRMVEEARKSLPPINRGETIYRGSPLSTQQQPASQPLDHEQENQKLRATLGIAPPRARAFAH